MTQDEVTPAPRWRRLLAGALDAATVYGIAWVLRRSGRVRAGSSGRVLSLVAAVGELARQHLRSPGQRLLGLRAVDARTGGGVTLWRTLAVFGGQAGGRAVSRLLAPTGALEEERQREQFMADLKAIMERHPHDGPARERERRALFDRYPRPNVLRKFGPPLAVGVVSSRLQRRLPPTIEVLVRRRR